MVNFVQDSEKEWILEAINHLKHRKARPDLSRISLRMKRKYQINFAQTKKLLESLIESGIVVKAVYKNNTSYRDVSKWKKGKLGGHIQNSSKMLKRFVRAIEAKEIEKGTGVTCQEIEEFLRSEGEEKCFLSGAALFGALEKEVSTGYLKQIYSGTVTRFLINKENEHLIKILKQTDDVDLDLDFDLDHVEESQSTSRTATDADSIAFKDKILTAVRDSGCSSEGGSSLCNIKQYLHERHCLFRNGIPLDLEKALEHFVSNGVLRKNGDLYTTVAEKASTSTRSIVTGSVECRMIDSNFGLVPSSTQAAVDSSSSNHPHNVDPGEGLEEVQQVKILQGLSLIPKSLTLKDSSKPSSLKILPSLSHAEVEDSRDVPNLGPSRPPSKRRVSK